MHPQPDLVLTLRTSSRPEAVRRARRALAAFEDLQTYEQIAFDAALLVSELVGNAVVHGNPGSHDLIELQAELTDKRLRVQVNDGGTGFSFKSDQTEPAGPEATSGRGLHLMRELADRFGVDRSRPGGHVWFEIDLTQPSRAPNAEMQ
ncbi:MAG TPA: ATP-binding protein [Gaiellaceae bacterium]|nr:ATP-binding protein [Gaiellaceae bacterium]